MALQSKLTLLLCVCLILTACQSTPSKTSHAIVLVDITSDDPNALPSSEEIITNIRKLHSNVQDGIKISFALLDDLSGAPYSELEITPLSANAALNNPVKREREIKEFFDKLKTHIKSKLASAQVDKDYSKIYIKLCKSLEYLLSGKADNKILILYSDLLENSEITSFYKNDQLDSAISHPLSFYENQLKNKCELADLASIEIYLQVMRESKSDGRIIKAEQFWKKLLEAKNGQVKVDVI